MTDFKTRIIKAVSDELQSSARQESQKAQGAVEYWTALAARAVNRTLQMLKDNHDERTHTIEAATGYNRPVSEIDLYLAAERQPRPARRRNAKKRGPSTAKRTPSRRKRSR